MRAEYLKRGVAPAAAGTLRHESSNLSQFLIFVRYGGRRLVVCPNSEKNVRDEYSLEFESLNGLSSSPLPKGAPSAYSIVITPDLSLYKTYYCLLLRFRLEEESLF